VLIRAIQQNCGVIIKVPQTTNRDPTAVKIRLGVAGPKDCVHKAKDVIKEIVQFYHSSVTHPGITHLEMEDIPASFYSYIIGPKGSEIRHIQANFNVSVHIPNADSQIQNVLIVGEKSKIEKAQRYILKVIDQATANKAAAERVFDQWEAKTEEKQEDWMESYTYKRNLPTDENSHPLSSQNKDVNVTETTSEGGKVMASAEEFAWRSVAVPAETGW